MILHAAPDLDRALAALTDALAQLERASQRVETRAEQLVTVVEEVREGNSSNG